MKRIFTPLQMAFIGLIAVCTASSCQREKLSEVVKTQSYAGVNASLPTRIDVTSANASQFQLTSASLTVPATITFSSPTSAAFTINLAANTDTVANLVTAGVLAQGTVPFPTGGAAVVPQITVPAGVTSVSFDVVVSRSALEVAYGKTLAAVIKASGATKGNKLVASSMIFTVKSSDVITAASIHDISWGVPNKIVDLDVPANSSYYSLGSLYVTLSIPVKLNGDAGAQFTVNVASRPDSVTNAINKGILPNSVLYPDSKISITNAIVTIPDGGTTAQLNVNVKINELLAVQPLPAAPSTKYPTIALQLTGTTRYSITTTRINTVYVVMDPNRFRPYYGTPFLVKGTPGVASDPIYMAYYDFGGEGVAYHDDSSKSGDGSWRLPDNVDVVPDYSPRSVIGWTNGGEWLSFSINVEAAGDYQLNLLAGSSGTNGRYSIYLDGVKYNATPYATAKTANSNNNNQGPNLTTITLPKGYHIIKTYWDVAAYDVRGIIFTKL